MGEVDALVREQQFADRSLAIECGMIEQFAHIRQTSLAESGQRLDLSEERALAEEGISADLATWPEY